jgi:hypothetical protein
MADYNSAFTGAQVDTAVAAYIAGLSPLEMDLAALGGATQDFTIPSGATAVDIGIDSLKRTGTVNSILQLGDATSVKTTGYVGGLMASGAAVSFNLGALLSASAATTVTSGILRIRRVNAAGFVYVMEGVVYMGTFNTIYMNATRIALVSELTTVRFATGSGIWDGGKVSAHIR